MPASSAYMCTQRDRTVGVTFHRFPSKPELRLLWVKAVRREHFIPSKSAVLCSQHFCEDDFDKTCLFGKDSHLYCWFCCIQVKKTRCIVKHVLMLYLVHTMAKFFL